ncbi:MAG: hypothetical protein LUG83_08715 [Lachnospiraceae bacterium]|nr:hypothetical protein [Lachnospiraceae bacterium]
MADRRKKSNRKVVKMRKPLNLNIGMLIFVAILFYVLICIVMYFRTSHIVRYEVKEGSLATDNTYRGVVLRDEEIVTLDTSGYVNYYARENSRVANGDLVYAVDETGRLNEYIEELSLGENTLTDRELTEFRSEIVNFMHEYDSLTYTNVYDFKYYLESTVLKIANNSMLQSINNMTSSDEVANIVNLCYASRTGIVSYWTDGYEALQAEDVTSDIFDTDTYEKKQLTGNELMAAGDAVYKLSTNENWSVVIPIDQERGAELLEEDYIKVRFLKNQYESWGKVSLLYNGDGNTYLQLSFTNSMITFVSDRFLDIELILNEQTGLKIPNSAIVQKEFFLVPEEFVLTEENDGQNGIYRECYLEDGTVSVEFVQMDFYSYDSDEKKYYLDNSFVSAGDILHRQDSQDTFVVSERATLTGVYNVNKGYADFKQINILYSNDEYSIVKANTDYGLRVYDYIALNADTVSDDQLIND